MIELLLAAERMLSVGLLDQAERLFNQVAEADPQNSIAVVGLARVTLERGDEAGAIALARRALEIDRENAAAQRMIERLEEVIATRDAAASGPALISEPVATGLPLAIEREPTAKPVVAPEAVRRTWLDRLKGFLGR
jgi:thioredoxin-like negative regulator of GroEL